jgi:hypothetical protein
MGDIGAMTAPILVGTLIDAFGFKPAFGATAALIVAAAATSAALTAGRPPRATAVSAG